MGADGLSPITAEDVMPLLLAACPSFRPRWEDEVRAENLDDEVEGGRLGYMDAADFIRHLVSLRQAGQTAEFEDVFRVIERLICDGDPYVQNLATIGYIEGFQMMTVTAAGLDPERDFRPHLLPRSEAAWQAVNEFWAGK